MAQTKEEFRTELQDVLEIAIGAGWLDLSKRKTIHFPCHFNKEFEEQSIELMTQDARSLNALHRGHIFTIADLIIDFEKLKTIRGLGTRTKQVIRVSLMDYYYQSLDTDGRAKFIKEIIDLNNGTSDPSEEIAKVAMA